MREALILKTLWTDKKRFWGMKKFFWIFPASFTKYTINEKAIIVKTGVLNTKEEQVILFRITDISLRKTLFNRIFSVGTLLVQSDDRTIPNLRIAKIKKPEALRDLLNDTIEKARRKNMVISREFLNKDTGEYENNSDESDNQYDDFPEGADS